MKRSVLRITEPLHQGSIVETTRELETLPRGAQAIVLRVLHPHEVDPVYELEARGKRLVAYLSDVQPTGETWEQDGPDEQLSRRRS